ncbi:MAG TPA: phosphatase PAP2 family protein [Gaiellaceae bacterium]|nr:phosphatase PAP2 family protein [Gaiellaceae bacterium]
MSAVVAVGRRLPRGWGDLGRQVAIWFGFLAIYQVARGFADRNPARAFQNGDDIVRLETRVTHRLYELTLQNFVDQKHWLETIVSWTYWNSEFTVLGLALLWVYLRRHESFSRFRNAILLANVFGLVGYILMPTAPPRLLGVGFTDQHRDGLVNLFANPYAAMPSLHAGDALIVGIVLATLCRSLIWKVVWSAWPAWIWFCVMATGNHFWLDCVAGSFVGLLAMAVVYRAPIRRSFAAHPA